MSRWTFAAQNVLTGEWYDFDLPLVRDAEQPRFELSGAGSLSGTINGTHPTLLDGRGELVLAEWRTVLYALLDGEVVGAYIVQTSDFNGSVWTVQAFGYTSYANGIPYTGDYQKFVEEDPSWIVQWLWQHVQSQPDGDLQLHHTLPLQMGPNIGTKDEPYELSWWEAKDCGDELQQLASEAPFDYVEAHRWDGATPQLTGSGYTVSSEGLSFVLGCGNLQGGYTGTDRGGWMKKRAAKQATFLPTLGFDAFIATELHEDKSSAMPDGADRYFRGLLRKYGAPDYEVWRGYRGNMLVGRTSKLKVWATENRRLPDPTGLGKELRAQSAWYVTFLETGLTGWLFAGHFRVDQGGKNLAPVRKAEASSLRDWANAHTTKPAGLPADVPDPMFRIIGGDFNDANHDQGEPMWLFEQGGYFDLKRRAGNGVPNAEQASGKGGKSGRWIDNLLTKVDEVDLSDVRGIPTHKYTDHKLFVAGRITPRVSTAVAAQLTGGLPKVWHEVVYSYPRAGRRRADLKFVQGDNVTEVVPFKRNGETFANTVVVLGKGEGKKTLRGEDGVRDGRLRRPVLYTDKLASTTARCKALAKRERGWRSLAPQVDSIVVADHPNAPLGSWQLGDDVLIEAYGVPHLGDVADWFRIMAWAPVTDTTARLTVTRADAFTYGPVVDPPTDLPEDEDPEDDIDEGDAIDIKPLP